MKLQESGEDYLESILKIERTKGVVRSVDVANDLNVSKPSVSRAMHILAERGFIQIEDNACRMEHTLSDESYAALKRFIEAHQVYR